MKQLCVAVVCFVLVTADAASGQSKNWKEQLQTALEDLYPRTEQARFEANQVTKPGVLLTLKSDNIQAEPVGNFGAYANRVRDGQVLAPGGGAAFFSRSNSRIMKPGDKMYVTNIRIHDDDVQFILLSHQMYDVTVRGTTKPTRVRAVLNFEFPKTELPSMNAGAVKHIVDSVLATETDAAAAATKTIELDQTIAQVEATFGKPDTIVKLGERVIYTYKSMKVVFVNGKVADVQ